MVFGCFDGRTMEKEDLYSFFKGVERFASKCAERSSLFTVMMDRYGDDVTVPDAFFGDRMYFFKFVGLFFC